MTNPTRPAVTTADDAPIPSNPLRLLPGILLCALVTAASMLLERLEVGLFSRPWLEALVIAILLGTAIRAVWSPSERWLPGIRFSAKTLLEIAIVLLGASLSAATVLAAGAGLLFGIIGVVVAALAASYAIGRMLGLPKRMATLVACGNSICGNSAIAAVAPVIGADSDDVAASIAFTAVLGVAVVVALPFLGQALALSDLQYGALAGLTVYAVPQVLAATVPYGMIAVQLGTLVKLIRVLMLGPVCLALALLVARSAVASGSERRWPSLGRLVPWFIIGFLGFAAARSFGLFPEPLLGPMAIAATLLTTISMAALGLGVDVRVVAKAGGPIVAAVTLSLLLLGAMSLLLVRLLGIA